MMLFVVARRRTLRRFFSTVLVLAVLIGLPFFSLPPRNAPASAAAGPQGIPLPVVMYHSLLMDPARAGQYVLSPETLEADLIYLKEHGYQTVTLRQAVDYVLNGGTLPEKPVLLTLDDGYLNNLLYLPDILERNDACALVSVVGDYAQRFTDTPDPNPNYGHMTWDDIAALAATGRVEIGNHSWGFHNQSPRRGSMRLSGESAEQYRAVLTADAQRVQDALTKRCGLTPLVFTYPYGQISDGADDILREMGFSATLSCYEQVTTLIPGQPECLFSIGRYNRPSGISTADFFARMGIS